MEHLEQLEHLERGLEYLMEKIEMLNRLVHTLEKLLDWRLLLSLFLVVVLFSLVIFPARARQVQAETGVRDSILDMRFSYTPQAAYNLFAELGEVGRRSYVTTALTLDLIYPIAYGLFLSLLILALYRKGFPDFPAAQKLALLPLAMLLADFLENFSISFLLLRYPQELPGLARVASFFTSLKWSLGAVIVIALFIGLPGWLTGGRSRRKIVAKAARR